MKKHFNFLFSTAAALLVLSGCKKEENRIFFEGGTAPVLTANTTAAVLAPGLEDQTAIVFNWTNPEYRFTTGISSQDVSYTLELDTVGANFGSKNKYVTTVSKDLSKSFTVSEINNIMGNTMLLKTGRQYNFETKITASIGSSAAVPLTSAPFRFTATPFTPPPKVELPTTGKLYLVGDASPGGWNNPVPTPSQEFTKVSNTMYEITVALSGGKSLLFLPLNGDWGDKYGWAGSNNGNIPEGDNLRRGGGDIKVPAASGNYKISVDFQLGKFTITKL
jgi:starch-binding outer membrane protein SusE/F